MNLSDIAIPILGLIAFLAAFPLLKELKKNRLKYTVIIAVGILLMGFQIYKSAQDSDTITDLKKGNDILKNKSDSLKEKVDSLLIQNESLALSLKAHYDTLGKKVDNIKPVTKIDVRNTMPEAYPVFMVKQLPGIKAIQLTAAQNNTYEYDLTLYSKDAASTDYKATIYTFVSDSSISEFHYMGKQMLLDSDLVLEKEIAYSQSVVLFTNKKFHTTLFLIRGTYKNINKTNTYPIEHLYGFSPNQNWIDEYPKKTRELVSSKIGIKD